MPPVLRPMFEIAGFSVDLTDGSDIGDIIATALGEIAPAIDIPALPRDAALREEVEPGCVNFRTHCVRDIGRRRFPATRRL